MSKTNYKNNHKQIFRKLKKHLQLEQGTLSLVPYPPLQKIIRETKLSYLGGLLLGSVIKSLSIVYPRAGGLAQKFRRLQAHCLWRRSSKGAGTQWQLEVRDYTKKHRGGCTRVLLRPGHLITNRTQSVRLVIRC